MKKFLIVCLILALIGKSFQQDCTTANSNTGCNLDEWCNAGTCTACDAGTFAASRQTAAGTDSATDCTITAACSACDANNYCMYNSVTQAGECTPCGSGFARDAITSSSPALLTSDCVTAPTCDDVLTSGTGCAEDTWCQQDSESAASCQPCSGTTVRDEQQDPEGSLVEDCVAAPTCSGCDLNEWCRRDSQSAASCQPCTTTTNFVYDNTIAVSAENCVVPPTCSTANTNTGCLANEFCQFKSAILAECEPCATGTSAAGDTTGSLESDCSASFMIYNLMISSIFVIVLAFIY